MKSKALLFLVIVCCGFLTEAQTLPVLKPVLGSTNIYSKTDQVFWQKILTLNAKTNSGDLSYKNLSAADKQLIDSLESGYGPMTQGVGCSWYCGGGPYKITSSSYLQDEGNLNYVPDNLHDFNLFTAWVPDNKTEAIGKKINFHFKPFSPRVDHIIIYNGYLKNIDLWKANSRVAKFKLLINGKPTAILELKDVTNAQRFKINAIQSTDTTKDLILTLEILEVYKGSKYSDVAISEINFDGLDVHCFAAGTKVLMSDYSQFNIELIKPGDEVLTYDDNSNQLRKTVVNELIIARHSNLVKLRFSDFEITVTDDHPFWVQSKKWASVNPYKSNTAYAQNESINQLSPGDLIFLPEENTFVELASVEIINEEQLTYTLELKEGDNFIVNGLLVKTEKVKWPH